MRSEQRGGASGVAIVFHFAVAMTACGGGGTASSGPTLTVAGSTSTTSDAYETTTTTTDETTETGDPDCPALVLDENLVVSNDTQDLDAVPRYTHVKGGVYVGPVSVDDTLSLSNLAFLECLREVDGRLILSDLPELLDVSALGKLERVGGDVVLSNLDSLGNVDGFESLERAGGLQVSGNSKLSSLEPFESLSTIASWQSPGGERIPGILEVWRNDALEVLGLRALQSADMVLIGGCEPIDQVENGDVAGNHALTEIDGLDSLASVGSVWVRGNSKLTSLDGLRHLREGVDEMPGSLYVELNSSLPYAHVLDIWGDVQGQFETLTTCGNLDEVTPCTCPTLDECNGCAPNWDP